MSGPLVIGVDGGGTRTRAIILDEEGVELGRAATGPALVDGRELPIDIEGVVSTVQSAAMAADIALPCTALCGGFAGVGREQERQAVEAALGSVPVLPSANCACARSATVWVPLGHIKMFL